MTSPGEESLWCVVGDDTNGYKFYNKASGTSKILGLTGTDGAARAKMIEEGANNYVTSFDITSSRIDGHFCMKQPNTNNYWNNRGKYLAYWNSTNALSGTGSAFLFEEADLEGLDFEFTDNTGTIHSGTGKCVKNSNDEINTRFTIAGIPSEWLTNVTTIDNVYKATIDLPFRLSSESKSKSNKFMMGGHGVTNFKIYADGDNVKVQKGKTPTTSDINQFLWEIYPIFEDGIIKFNIKNVQTGEYIYSATPKTEHAEGTLSLDPNNKSSFILKKIGNDATFAIDGVNLSISSSGNNNVQYVGLNSYTHAGSNMTFIPYWITYTLTDMAGGVHTGEYEGWSNLRPELPTFTGAEGYSVGEKTWGNGTVSATIDFGLTVSSETVANPILIGQGTWDGANSYEKLWKVVDGNVKVVDGTPYLGTSLWLIYPTLTGAEFTYKIKSVSTDKYVTANLESGDDAEANNTPITLTSTGTAFRYQATTCGSDKGFAYTNDNSTVMYLTRNGINDNDKLLGVHQAKASHNGNGIRFPEFTEYNVTIGETGYTTVYSPFTAITSSSDLKIYTITSAPQGNSVTLNLIKQPTNEEVSNYIYENQGVIIKGNPDTYTFTLTDWEDYYDADDWTNDKENMLKGSVTNTYVKGDAYVLSAPNGVGSVGLYKATLNKDENGNTGESHFKNNAGKAYLPAAASGARFLVFSFGDDMETGITETENENVKTENTVVYDLAGRRVQGAQKGIFIVNGKKVVR